MGPSNSRWMLKKLDDGRWLVYRKNALGYDVPYRPSGKVQPFVNEERARDTVDALNGQLEKAQ